MTAIGARHIVSDLQYWLDRLGLGWVRTARALCGADLDLIGDANSPTAPICPECARINGGDPR